MINICDIIHINLNTRKEINIAVAQEKRKTYYNEDTQTLIGTKKKELLDMETGEIIHVDNIIKRTYGAKRFWKLYLMDFLTVLGIIDSKQLDVFIFILEHTNQSNNLFIGTYDEIAKQVGVCRQTIAKIMKKLQEHNFVKKKHNGVWFVNPNILMKGNDQKRQILLSYYQSDEKVDSLTLSRRRQQALSTDDDTDGNDPQLFLEDTDGEED